MRKPVLNSISAHLPETVKAGEPFVIQVAPPGEYPQWIEDPENPSQQKEVVQILDEKAMNAMVENFKDKVLVDADHSSEISTNTAAMGWVTKLFVDPEKGLMAEIEPTSEGVEKINGKVYRFVSGAWILDEDNRPTELVSIGLTNKPNLPVRPMINAQAVAEKKDELGAENKDGVTDGSPSATDDQPDAANAGAQENPEGSQGHDGSQSNNQGNHNMDKVKELLGLAVEATDEEVYAAIDALISRSGEMEAVTNALGLEPTATNEEVQEALNAVINQCGELQAKNEEAEKARLNAEADQLVAENEDVIPEESVAEIKDQYVEDPEAAKATVANMRRVYDRAILNAAKNATPKVRVVNAKEAKAPKVLNMKDALAECGGDPAKENAVCELINKTNIPTSGEDATEFTDENGNEFETGTGETFSSANEVVMSGDLTKKSVAALRKACHDADISVRDTILALNPVKFAELLSLLDAHMYGGTEAIRDGMIPNLYGYKAVMEMGSLSADTGENLVGALIPASAIAVASRTVDVLNPKLYDEIGTATDDNSGLVLQMRRGGDWKTGDSVATVECLFGAKLVQPTKIVRLVSSATSAG